MLLGWRMADGGMLAESRGETPAIVLDASQWVAGRPHDPRLSVLEIGVFAHVQTFGRTSAVPAAKAKVSVETEPPITENVFEGALYVG